MTLACALLECQKETRDSLFSLASIVRAPKREELVAALLFSPGLSHLSSVGFQRATRLCATPQPLITRRQEKSIQSFELDPGDFVTTQFLRTKTHAYFVHQNPLPL
jgi:hypothetical protein